MNTTCELHLRTIHVIEKFTSIHLCCIHPNLVVHSLESTRIHVGYRDLRMLNSHVLESFSRRLSLTMAVRDPFFLQDGGNKIIRQVWSLRDSELDHGVHRRGVGLHPWSHIHSDRPDVLVGPCK